MWIESHQALGRHPKLLAFAAELQIHRAQAVGHLQYLWWWAVDYATDGNLSHYEDGTIAQASEWSGDGVVFVQALRRAGWLDEDGALHDWDVYAGRLIERRKADAERKRLGRTSEGESGDSLTTTSSDPQPVPEMSGGRPPDKERTAHVDLDLPDLPTNQTITSLGSPRANGTSESKKDEFFEALVEASGYRLGDLTRDQRGETNRAAKQLREVGATPPLIRGFGDIWTAAHADIPVRPQIVVNHWADYMAGKIRPLERRRA